MIILRSQGGVKHGVSHKGHHGVGSSPLEVKSCAMRSLYAKFDSGVYAYLVGLERFGAAYARE